MRIEFLYFKDCPGYKSGLSLLQRILLESGAGASIEMIEVTTQELAEHHRFLGSPSIRINGKDIEDREEASEYGLKCRIYSDTSSGVPSESILRKALLEAEKSP